MSAPIFSAQPSGNIAQQYLHRARMFRDAARQLPDYSNGEQYWPKYALLTHAFELSLKAFAQPLRSEWKTAWKGTETTRSRGMASSRSGTWASKRAGV